MEGLKEIKQRIKGVSNIQQITRAMEMVAANRLRKTESRVLNARPFAENIYKLLRQLSTSMEEKHLYFEKKEDVKIIKVLLITSDRGLCGAYNTNVIQKALNFIKERQAKEIKLNLLGKKGRFYFQKKGFKIDKYYPVIVEKLALQEINKIARGLIAEFDEGEFDEFYAIYTRFEGISRIVPTVLKLLPVDQDTGLKVKAADYIFEPSCDEILGRLLPKYIISQINQVILESLTSEYAARRVAMRNASDNAEEMIGNLKKSFNRVRQESITKELLEIVSGAEALAK